MKKRIDPGYLISLLLSVVLAFVIGAVILAIAGFSPGKAYLAMLNGAFSSARHIGDLLEYAMVLCLCGLACVLGARVGIFNVGGEGQLLLGAIVACQVGVWRQGTVEEREQEHGRSDGAAERPLLVRRPHRRLEPLNGHSGSSRPCARHLVCHAEDVTRL